MKNVRIALLALFFHICSFAYPIHVQAAIPLIIPAAAIGAALVASTAGTYYAKTGNAPQWVSATANAAASAADYIFSPGALAIGPMTLITTASFPAVSSNYLAKNAWIGAKLDDLIQASKNAAAGVCDTFKAMVAARTSTGQTPNPVTGNILTYNGTNYLLTTDLVYFGDTTAAGWSAYPSIPGTNLVFIGGNPVQIGWRDLNSTSQYGASYKKSYKANVNTTTTQNNYPPPPIGAGAIDYPGLKGDMFPWLSSNPADIANLVRQLGIDKIKPAEGDSCPPYVDTAPAAPTLPATEQQAALDQNKVDVAQKAADIAKTQAQANPSDAAAQIAATAAQKAAADSVNAKADVVKPAQSIDWGTASAPNVQTQTIKTVDFTPIKNLSGVLMSKFPFSIIGLLGSIFDPVANAIPTPPNFTIDLGILRQYIDFSFLNSFAASVRAVMSFLCLCLTAFAALRIFSR